VPSTGVSTALCAECDRCFHLSVCARAHVRVPLQDSEEQMTVTVKDGTARLKTPLLVLAIDAQGAKAVLELKTARSDSARAMLAACRFCKSELTVEESATSEVLGIGKVCSEALCQQRATECCNKLHSCGHPCGGVAGEEICLPCLEGCDTNISHFADSDDFCQICWTEPLSAAPSIRLGCGHVVHYNCAKALIAHRWNGPVISFSPWSQCPSCKATIDHPLLEELMAPIRELKGDVERKALMRLEFEKKDKDPEIVEAGGAFHRNPVGFALKKYNYYMCYKCEKPYFGGERDCGAAAGAAANADDYDPSELVCAVRPNPN
jgi:E3 ubiquitin-protein ligase MYCBP2